MNFPFTLVSTILNEGKRIEQTINDLSNQRLQPSEIIITDAGSTDGTLEALLNWQKSASIPIIIIQKKGCNVAEGRNLAIRKASYRLIVSTDFGCRFHPDWLYYLTLPFENAATMVTGGRFGVIEQDQQSLPAKASYISNGGYNINVHSPLFIPSSRSIAYRKEVFEAIGGYQEWLTLAGDDLVFGKQLKAKGYTIVIVDKLHVHWLRHTTAKGFIKEANRYGLGDGEAKVNFRNFMITLTECIFRYAFVALLLILLFLPLSYSMTPILLILLALSLTGFRSYGRYARSWLQFRSKKYNVTVFLYGFYLLEATRFSYILGYMKGYFLSTPLQKEAAVLLRKRL